MSFGVGETEAAGLLGDLKALALPLLGVVLAGHAHMDDATDAVKIFRSRTPSGADFARQTGEAAVVVGVKVLPDSVDRVQIGRCGQAQFAAKAILEYPQRRSTRAAMKVLPS